MYSMVLMAALTAGTATPDCHRCCGCCGCYGGCYGCWGGCYGGCYGCGGCYGGCMGCMGCYGGCMGCMGCYGGCMGCYGGMGGMGGYGGWGGGYAVGGAATYPGTVYPGGGTIVPGGATGPTGEPLNMPEDTSKSRKKEGTMLSNKAKLIVEVPSNAKLFIDDMPMKKVSGVRSFNTPELAPGQAYYYVVRVEAVRDGKPISETRRVIVRAGQIARADFKDMDTEAEAVRTAQAK